MTRAPQMPAAIAEEWPAIALVRPQMGENIGACARAMLNFGLTQLVLVEPRDRWPNPKAQAVAAGADAVLDNARLEWSLDAALAPATLVVAATARPRRLEKPVWGPRECAEAVLAAAAAGERPLVMFGAEAMGLTTDEVARADATQQELEGLFQHLETELDRGRFYHPEDKAPLMKQNLRAMFLRIRMTQQECQTMRGVLKALTVGRGGRKKEDGV